MAKDRFTRQNIHDINMKKIILRLDYAGVMDTLDLVRVFEKRFPKAFKKKNEIVNREVNLIMKKSDFEEIGKTLSLPVNIIEKGKVARYKDLRKEVSCDVTMDISQFYLLMVIVCNGNYDGLGNYTEIFKGTISSFKDKIDYFQPKRLGLRKFRQEVSNTIESAKQSFESFIFPEMPYALQDYNPIKSEYLDCISSSDNRLKFNIRSRIQKVLNENREEKYDTLLDIDSYCDKEELLAGDINALLTEANLDEFEIYKSCMSEQYLHTICQ